MIKVLYTPQVNSEDEIIYKFEGEKLTAYFKDEVDIFDFSTLPEGAVDSIESDISVDVVREAFRKDGVLHLTLLKFIGPDATREERFPTWQVIQ